VPNQGVANPAYPGPIQQQQTKPRMMPTPTPQGYVIQQTAHAQPTQAIQQPVYHVTQAQRGYPAPMYGKSKKKSVQHFAL